MTDEEMQAAFDRYEKMQEEEGYPDDDDIARMKFNYFMIGWVSALEYKENSSLGKTKEIEE